MDVHYGDWLALSGVCDGISDDVSKKTFKTPRVFLYIKPEIRLLPPRRAKRFHTHWFAINSNIIPWNSIFPNEQKWNENKMKLHGAFWAQIVTVVVLKIVFVHAKTIRWCSVKYYVRCFVVVVTHLLLSISFASYFLYWTEIALLNVIRWTIFRADFWPNGWKYRKNKPPLVDPKI